MKKFIIKVNGNAYEVEVEEVGIGGVSERKAEPQQAPSSPPPQVIKSETKSIVKTEKKDSVVSQGQEVVEAPMPGTILSVNVKEGENVKAGDVLIVLEAMKMENEILAPRDGKVASIGVSIGSAVSTGDKLVVLD